jgi:putative transposase
MARQRRSFAPATSYHVTMRCNNQAFDLRRPQSRKAILFCLAKARGKFDFALFGICVMSNHVHYMIRPARPADMPRLMHWLNWYSAMLLNRLLRRRGHFWERRYHAAAVPDRDYGHALRVLRYIHANPRAAGMIQGYAYAYSNYRSYARPADDGLSAWHPAYLRLGPTLDHCAQSYELFCRRYRSEPKRPSWPRWGGWRLRREISGKPAKGRIGDQADLFAPPAAAGARYHGGVDRCGEGCRSPSCGPMCFGRSSDLSASISHLPQCRPMPSDDEGWDFT